MSLVVVSSHCSNLHYYFQGLVEQNVTLLLTSVYQKKKKTENVKEHNKPKASEQTKKKVEMTAVLVLSS